MSDHFATAWRHARKGHTCELCRRTIRSGERYLRGAGMNGSTAWSWAQCAHCTAILNLARDPYETDFEWETIADWSPQTTAQLRALVMWRRQWTRSDGSPFPIPDPVMHEHRHGFQIDVRHPG